MTEPEIRMGVENERADARKDDRPCLSRRKSQARTGTGKTNKQTHFLFSADHEQKD